MLSSRDVLGLVYDLVFPIRKKYEVKGAVVER